MARKVVWTQNASDEWKHILDFWIDKTGNKKYSRKLDNKIRIILNYIKNNNYIGNITSYKNIRLVVSSHYKIFYKIDKEIIYLISIFDSRRDPKESKYQIL